MAKRKKSVEEKIAMLRMGLNALYNANKHFQETKDESYILTIQSQLRGLVGMGGKSMNPFLINLSEELKIDLKLYVLPIPTNNNISDNMVVGKRWSSTPMEGFEELSLEEWLNRDEYFTRGSMQFKNRNQIIKDASNYEGGTHYLEETPHIVETLNDQNVGGKTNLISTLIDIGMVVYYLGYLLILEWQYKYIENLMVIRNEERGNMLFDIDRIKRIHTARYKFDNSKMNCILSAYIK